MKIVKIAVYQVDLPYSGGVYLLSNDREYHSFDATLVCVTTDTGLQGWGESTPFGSTYIAAHALGVRAAIAEMAPQMLGLNPCHCDRINEAMDQTLVGHLAAKTAIDVACWDIFGQAVSMPVCDLLGGRIHQPMPVISSIYAGEPEDMRQRVQAHRAQGYLGHSIKIGAHDAEGGPALDAERIRACLADRVAGEFFLVDANGGMTVETVLRMLQLLPKQLDFVIEAPCATWRENMSLRKRTQYPMIFDELANSDASIIDIIAQDAAEGIGLKISKAGGLTRGRRQRDMCLAAGLTLSVQDTVGSDIAFAAVVHLGQTVPSKFLRCVIDTRDMVSVSTAQFEAPIKDGGVIAPDAPGLGVTPDYSVIGAPVAVYA